MLQEKTELSLSRALLVPDMGLGRAWHTILLLHLTHASRPWMPRAHRRGKKGAQLFEGERAAKKVRPRSGGLW